MGRIFEVRKHTMFARWDRMAKQFARIAKDINIAVKAGGGDVNSNPALRRAVQNARHVNMPKDKVDAAIKRALGNDSANYEQIIYEGYAPHGVAIIVEAATDNATRTVAQVRTIFSKGGGNLGTAGSVAFQFRKMGVFRLKPDGSVPTDNPFADKGGITAQIWSLGHRNLLGIAFDGTGRLWQQEMGPKGGDEVNLVERGGNYGYPIVSNGDHYDGKAIPDHPTRPEFNAPKLWWNPSISPAGLAWYGGDLYPGWKNSLLMGALSGEGLIRMGIDGDRLHKSDRWDFGTRIREVEVHADGSVWLLTDGKNGKLVKLVSKG